jgi:hypothetical protein
MQIAHPSSMIVSEHKRNTFDKDGSLDKYFSNKSEWKSWDALGKNKLLHHFSQLFPNKPRDSKPNKHSIFKTFLSTSYGPLLFSA